MRLLGVHAFLMTAFTYLATMLVKGKSSALLWLIAISLALFGALLGIFQASFGRQTGRAIGFWREYLKVIEDKWQVPFDHLQYKFYAEGKAETPFGLIDKEKTSQKALYELFGKKTRWLTSMTTVLGLLFSAGLALFWTLAFSYTVQQLTERYCVSVSVSACAVLLLLGVLVLRPSLAKAQYPNPARAHQPINSSGLRIGRFLLRPFSLDPSGETPFDGKCRSTVKPAPGVRLRRTAWASPSLLHAQQ